MAYDEILAERIRVVIEDQPEASERKMFGGLCFMVAGKVGPDAYEAALCKPHAREMDFTGRPMRGMVYVEVAGIRTRRQLSTWVSRGMRTPAHVTTTIARESWFQLRLSWEPGVCRWGG